LVKFPSFSLNRRENDILDGIEKHLAIVGRTVESFARLVDAAAKGKATDAKASFEAVIAGEKEADQVHRGLSMRIAEGAFFGGIREDILNLLEKIDNIADSAKDASRFLESEGSLDAFAVSLLNSEAMNHFIVNLKSAVHSLAYLVAAFRNSRKEMLARIHKVEECEEAADSNKDQLMGQLFANTTQPNPITVIQMRDFLFVADDIADYAEDASDVVLVLLAKGYD
jgi:predicted phosphate transport protein (TIGR00153 family)